MKNVFPLLAFAVMLAPALQAQTKLAYKFSDQIEADFASSERESKFQRAAWEYSFIGEYAKSKEKTELEYRPQYSKISHSDSVYLNSFKPADAKQTILNEAKNRQLVIINESHTDVRHRKFTSTLLQDLYKSGFRYLALEALSAQDSLINQRKYPIVESGYYCKEPRMGNLIREALALGFTLVAYESESHKNSEERETNQAVNIKTVFDKDPTAKMIVHCGHDHVYEDVHPYWGKAMAGRLKDLTNIDPLTINQVFITENSKYDLTHPAFRMSDILNPFILVTEGGEIFTSLKQTSNWDISVFHPFPKEINGRPDWLASNENKVWYNLRKKDIKLSYPLLILARKAGEPEEAVPIDIVEIKSSEQQKALLLAKGKYVMTLIDKSGKCQMVNVKVK